jgi:hypothetical protein
MSVMKTGEKNSEVINNYLQEIGFSFFKLHSTLKMH